MNEFEISILLWIQENLRGVLDGFWVAVTSLGDGGWFWISLGVAFLLFKKTRIVGITMLVSLMINGLLTNVILKALFARPRPFNVNPELLTLISKPTSFSFPSGHTSVSFAGALVLLKMLPKKAGVPAVILAAMVGFSRMYVGVHYPTDVLGGILVGMIASAAASCLISYVQKWKIEKKKCRK